MEKAGEESPHPRIRQKGHGLGQEPQKSRLQQNLQENDIQPLGSLQIGSHQAPLWRGFSMSAPKRAFFEF